MNEIYLEEKECTIKETGETVKYIAPMWRIGSQVIQLKTVYKSDKGAIRVLADSGMVEFKKMSEVK